MDIQLHRTGYHHPVGSAFIIVVLKETDHGDTEYEWHVIVPQDDCRYLSGSGVFRFTDEEIEALGLDDVTPKKMTLDIIRNRLWRYFNHEHGDNLDRGPHRVEFTGASVSDLLTFYASDVCIDVLGAIRNGTNYHELAERLDVIRDAADGVEIVEE